MQKPIIEELRLGDRSFYDLAEYFSVRDHFSFLDSHLTANDLGNYSFLAFSPFAIFKSKGRSIQLRQGDCLRRTEDNPFNFLQNMFLNYKVSPADHEVLFPFIGGGIGYFSYELGRHLEVLPRNSRDEMHIPECCVCLYNFCIMHDHRTGKTFLIYLSFKDMGHCPDIRKLRKEINTIPAGIYEKNNEYHNLNFSPEGLRSDFTVEKYMGAVNRIKEYIFAGDVYQVNMTQRFSASMDDTKSWPLYKNLMRLNPAPFSSFLNYDDVCIASSSPERFLKVCGRLVETRPIKGTIGRGQTPEEDIKKREYLSNSIKDRAELAMIVDLLRNDLGKVCTPGSVRVKSFPEVETYSSVHHLVSTITGKLEEGKDIFDILKASFPGGSITGAPKIRAMEIIDELEPVERGIYTGSLGYIGFDGNADLNIVIRTVVMSGGKAYIQVGGGVVADSVDSDEYNETLVKAKNLFKAIHNG